MKIYQIDKEFNCILIGSQEDFKEKINLDFWYTTSMKNMMLSELEKLGNVKSQGYYYIDINHKFSDWQEKLNPIHTAIKNRLICEIRNSKIDQLLQCQYT